MAELRKAQRNRVKVRIGMSGPSGAGKTRSALEVAYGLCGNWEKIAVIDSENGSADLYSHLGPYNVLALSAPFTPESYIRAIRECEFAGMDVIIIDSISHEWEGEGGCLEINDSIAKAKFGGNTWAAWSVTGERHQKFINKILYSDCHIITTVRNKTETAQVDGKIKKLGVKEITREGFESELTINFNIDREKHFATASKDRTELFIDRDPFLITRETGREILDWNNLGAETPPKKTAHETAGDLYFRFDKELKDCKDMEELKLINAEIFKNKDQMNDSQNANLTQLKDDMKASLAQE